MYRPVFLRHVLIILNSSLIFLALQSNLGLAGADPDWSQDFSLPLGEDRANLYNLSDDELRENTRRGKFHALHYPVGPTGILIPWNAFDRLLKAQSQSRLANWLDYFGSQFFGYRSMEDITRWLGLHRYPESNTLDQNPYGIPFPDGKRPGYRMGVTMRTTNEGIAATFGCASCHAGNLFGKRVLGMSNRFPRANEFFLKAKLALPYLTPEMFQWLSSATDGERKIYEQARNSVHWISTKKPAAVGSDTSLAQVGLSLSMREQDSYASRTPHSARYPRKNILDNFVADSKPAVWWNLKYKTPDFDKTDVPL